MITNTKLQSKELEISFVGTHSGTGFQPVIGAPSGGAHEPYKNIFLDGNLALAVTPCKGGVLPPRAG